MNYEKIADEFIELLTAHSRRKTDSISDYFHENMSGEYAVLSELADKGAVTPGNLSSVLCRSTARIANTLKSLENKGLVKRQHDAHDKRRVLVEITDKGKQIVKQKKEELRVITAKFFESLGESDAAEFMRLEKKALSAIGVHRKAEEL